MDNYCLKLNKISKSFGVKVLDDIDFALRKGEIHALVGGNGAGKSTLMKIMTGVYSKDSGTIEVNGHEVDIHNVENAQNHGIAMIFQELSLIQTMTISENIFLGREIMKNGFRNTKKMNEETSFILNKMGLDLNPEITVEHLSVGNQQMVEIAKALSKNAKILVLDEPTASLTDNETQKLFEIMHSLKTEGVSMIYISHRMNEIFKIADSVSVLRDGKLVFESIIQETSIEEIILHMLGSTSDVNLLNWQERSYSSDEVMLQVIDLSINDQITNINFDVKKGEILGLAGLMGSGRTEIVETIFGIRKKLNGTVLLNGENLEINCSADAVKAGIALIPEDRRRQGLVLIHTLKDNILLPNIKAYEHNGWINENQAVNATQAKIDEFNIIAKSMFYPINLLSGGNQQKAVIAKWMDINPKVLMLDEPTAGIDIGAKEEIINIVRNYADQGNSVIFISSELSELLAICDRILVLHDGVISENILRKEILKEEELQYAIQVS